MRKILLIYNPWAGRGRIRSSLSYVLEEFAAHNIEVTVHPTQRAGDASDAVVRKGREYDFIVCCGGDGTLDEVVTGMMNGDLHLPIGYIPTGSTNDFANSLGLPREIVRAASAIATGKPYTCDLGKMNDSYFIYVAAFGAFTEVSYSTSQESKNLLGHMAYMLGAMKAFPAIKGWKLSFKSEERSGSGEFMYGMITNSNTVGGFKGITGNDISLNDGLFEVTLITLTENVLEWPIIAAALLNGESNAHIISFKTRRIEIRSAERMPWTTDGEYGGIHTEVVIENIPNKLSLILDDQPKGHVELDDPFADEI